MTKALIGIGRFIISGVSSSSKKKRSKFFLTADAQSCQSSTTCQSVTSFLKRATAISCPIIGPKSAKSMVEKITSYQTIWQMER